MSTMTAETEIRWLDFCDQEMTRYSLGEPRVINGFKVATDCRMAIGLPTDEPDSPPAEKKFPDVCQILSPVMEQIGDYAPWPNVPPCKCCEYPADGKLVKCPTCKGTRKAKCEECHGLGAVECNMGHDHDCEDCDGKGTYDCEDCIGGVVNRDQLAALKCDCVASVGGRHVSSKLFDKISRLPAVEYFVPDRLKDQVWFRFSGNGVGVVMCIETNQETKWRN